MQKIKLNYTICLSWLTWRSVQPDISAQWHAIAHNSSRLQTIHNQQQRAAVPWQWLCSLAAAGYAYAYYYAPWHNNNKHTGLCLLLCSLAAAVILPGIYSLAAAGEMFQFLPILSGNAFPTAEMCRFFCGISYCMKISKTRKKLFPSILCSFVVKK